jgi:aspartate/methionine/tyrosine aminotransferase
MFSRRTQWESSSNRLTEILEARRSAGRRVIDLTVSNPTACGFTYPSAEILAALAGPGSLSYSPDPQGLPPAREAVAEYYAGRGIDVSPGDLFITASTSESYSLLFRLLCNVGDAVSVPTPSYPLFDYLAGINDVRTEYYRLAHDGRWRVDAGSLAKSMTRHVRALLVVDPHNPTGMSLSAEERSEVSASAAIHGAALIVDEVFDAYRFAWEDRPSPAGTAVPAAAPYPAGGLTFHLNGLSKMAGLPQVKIGWIAMRGEPKLRAAARSRLQILNDMFLSAGTPAQSALGSLLGAGTAVRGQILGRISRNMRALRERLHGVAGCSVLEGDGGWSSVVRLPAGLGDEECAEGLLDEAGVYTYPGYFFDFEEDDVAVVSLLPGEEEFLEGVSAMAEWIGANAGRSM